LGLEDVFDVGEEVGSIVSGLTDVFGVGGEVVWIVLELVGEGVPALGDVGEGVVRIVVGMENVSKVGKGVRTLGVGVGSDAAFVGRVVGLSVNEAVGGATVAQQASPSSGMIHAALHDPATESHEQHP